MARNQVKFHGSRPEIDGIELAECLLSARSRHWLTVNATSKPPHFGASRAYLEDVTAAEFCEEGGHGLEVGET